MTWIGKIKETFFTGYYSHSTESNRISTIEAYFTVYYSHLIESSRTSIYDNRQKEEKINNDS